eukprot:3805015-Prymnesium_polylepis.1
MCIRDRYAKSNRAECKLCKNKIAKGAIRIGTSVPGPGDYDMTSWRHLECQKKPAGLSDVLEIAGLDTVLKPEDTARVREWWDNPVAFATKRK